MNCCKTNTNSCTTSDSSQAGASARPVFRPNVDILETAEGFTIIADVPGATPESIDLRVEGRTLTLRAGVSRAERAGARQVMREYDVGDYERVFRLGDGVDTGAIAADLKSGVLTLTLPKARVTQAKKINVLSN